ncbi:flagellar protein FliT [Paraburkholderia strydomiana]
MEQTTLIERLWKLTQEIARAASLADWTEAARLTEERSSLFSGLAADQTAVAMEVIRRIQAADSALLVDARTTQGELEIEYQAAMSRVQATTQYQRVARF